jgi:hypothetical protein
MHAKHHQRLGREGPLFGMLLVAIGSILLLDRFGYVDRYDIWDWWPLVPIAFGAARIVAWTSASRVASGLEWVLFGLWFIACQRHWYGLSWSESWPLVLVGIGAGMVTRALLEPAFERPAAADPVRGGDPRA